MKLLQIAQHAEDLDRAAEYYATLLDKAPKARLEGQVYFEFDGVRLVLEASAPSALISLQVDNVHEVIERLGGLAEVISRPTVAFTHGDEGIGPSGHEEWRGLIRDSEGNTIALVAFQRP